MASQALRRSQRLRSRKDFIRLQRSGRRRTSRHFVLLVGDQYPPSGEAPARLGVTVSRKVGSAVARNRVKRRIRENFRTQPVLPAGRDLVVIARRGAAELEAAAMARQLTDLLAGDGK